MAEQAKKRFGQNFLHDKNMVAKIVAIVDPRPTDAMVEIGPGRGAMTAGLIEGTGHLTAIEIDRDLHQALTDTFGERLRLIAQDVLTVDFASLAELGRPAHSDCGQPALQHLQSHLVSSVACGRSRR